MLLFGLSTQAIAGDFYRTGQDFRSLSMGGTGVVTSNSSYTLFQNPAALSNVFDWWTDTPALQVTISDDLKSDAQSAMTDGDAFFNDLINNMSNYTGSDYYLRIQAGLNIVSNLDPKGFSIAGNAVLEHTVHAQIRNAASPEFQFFQREDSIKTGGFSFPIGVGKMVFGLGYRQVDRQEMTFTYDAIDAANGAAVPEIKFPGVSTSGVKGSGGGFDIGFIYRTASDWHLTWGGVWRNEIDLGDATSIPAQLDLGVGMRHDLQMFRFIAEIDLKDATRQLGTEGKSVGEKSLLRRLHYGAELGLFPVNKTYSLISLRGGYNSGYATYGWEFHMPGSIYFGWARYTEEIGEYSGQRGSIRSDYYLAIDIFSLLSFLSPI